MNDETQNPTDPLAAEKELRAVCDEEKRLHGESDRYRQLCEQLHSMKVNRLLSQ